MHPRHAELQADDKSFLVRVDRNNGNGRNLRHVDK